MRNYLRAGGVVLLLGTLVVVGRSWSGTRPPQAPRTRIALVNLAYVLKHYKKSDALKPEVDEKLKSIRKRVKEMEAQVEALTKELKNLDPDNSSTPVEETQQRLKQLLHELQNLPANRNVAAQNMNAQSGVASYRDVMDAVKRYANSHNVELVLQYSDAMPDDPDYFLPINISRKIQAGACIPLYLAPGIDVSKEIVAALNARQQAEKKPAETDEP